MNTFTRCALTITLLVAGASAAEFPAGKAYVGTLNGVAAIDLETGVVSEPLPALAGKAVYGITFGPDGLLYACVPFDQRVAILDATGAEVGSTKPVGTQLGGGVSVELGADGFFYAVNEFGRVLVFEPDGTYQRSFLVGTSGDSTVSLAIGPDGHVFVPNFSTQRLVELDPSGIVLGSLELTGYGCAYPRQIASGPDGRFYVTHGDGSKVFLLDSKGAQVTSSTLGSFSAINDLTVGPDGLLYVVRNKDILVLDPHSLALLATHPLAEPSKVKSIAFAPYRFKAKLKGQLRQRGLPPRNVNESVALTLMPGSRTLMIQLKDDAAVALDLASVFGSPHLVFRGYDDEGEGKKRRFHGASVPSDATNGAVGSFVIDVSGSIDKTTGAFRPKQAKGSVHRAGSAGAFLGQLVTKGALK